MNARIIYFVEHLNYGDSDAKAIDRTGWYLMRATVIDERGKGLANGAVIDRTPVAKFGAGAARDRFSHSDIVYEANQMSEGIASGQFLLMGKGWVLADVAKAAGGGR